VCVSVRVSVTSRYCVETAQRIVGSSWFSATAVNGVNPPVAALRVTPVADLGYRAGGRGRGSSVKGARIKVKAKVPREISLSSLGARGLKSLERGLAPSPEKFLTSEWKIVRFVHSGCYFCRLQ